MLRNDELKLRFCPVFCSPKNTYSYATVFTNRPLKDEEVFFLSLKRHDDVNWNGSLVVGVTTGSPAEVDFNEWMLTYTDGHTIAYEAAVIQECAPKEEATRTDVKVNLNRITVSNYSIIT